MYGILWSQGNNFILYAYNSEYIYIYIYIYILGIIGVDDEIIYIYIYIDDEILYIYIYIYIYRWWNYIYIYILSSTDRLFFYIFNQFFRRALHYANGSRQFLRQSAQPPWGSVHIVIHRQIVSFYQNSSVWLDTQDARSRDRNPSNFTLD